MSPTRWKDRVRDHFDAAADTYDTAARVQAIIANDLAVRILSLVDLPQGGTGLDIGCGTGALSEAVLSRRPDLSWISTDLSPRMLDTARKRLAAYPMVRVRLMDGEAPDLPERTFDLVCSSLAAQWFLDLEGTLKRLFALTRPGGVLAVTTLGSATFAEWKEACARVGVEAATPTYPTLKTLQSALPADAVVERRAYPLDLPSGRDFLNHLRQIGAQTAAPGHPPLSAAALRKILRQIGDSPFRATYDVLTILWKRV